MIPYKAKVRTTPNERILIDKKSAGKLCVLEAVYFDSVNPSAHLTVFDKDGDQVIHLIPGQLEHNNVVILESPVTVQLPFMCEDTEGNNEVILYGTLHSKRK